MAAHGVALLHATTVVSYRSSSSNSPGSHNTSATAATLPPVRARVRWQSIDRRVG